jgi:predicted DNA-binding transcriptional regulator AlpA
MEGDNIMCDLCEKSILEVEDIQSILGISRNKAYQLVNLDEFHVVRIGRLIKVSRKVFEDWLNGEGVTNA